MILLNYSFIYSIIYVCVGTSIQINKRVTIYHFDNYLIE